MCRISWGLSLNKKRLVDLKSGRYVLRCNLSCWHWWNPNYLPCPLKHHREAGCEGRRRRGLQVTGRPCQGSPTQCGRNVAPHVLCDLRRHEDGCDICVFWTVIHLDFLNPIWYFVKLKRPRGTINHKYSWTIKFH